MAFPNCWAQNNEKRFVLLAAFKHHAVALGAAFEWLFSTALNVKRAGWSELVRIGRQLCHPANVLLASFEPKLGDGHFVSTADLWANPKPCDRSGRFRETDHVGPNGSNGP